MVSSIPNIRPAIALDASAAWADWPSEVRDFEGKFLEAREGVVSVDNACEWLNECERIISNHIKSYRMFWIKYCSVMEWPNGTNRVCPRCFPLFRWRTPKIWIAQAAVTWSRLIFRNLSEAGLSNPWTSGKLRFTAVYLSNITHISAWRVHGTKHAVILLLSLLSGTGFVNVDEIQTYFNIFYI